MEKKENELFQRALETRDRGELAQAAQLMEELMKNKKDSANAFLVLGDLYSDLGLPGKAVDAFRAAVALRPYSELPSISLFTTLWKFGAKEEALEEMKRFLSHSESPEYQEILNEIMSKIDPK